MDYPLIVQMDERVLLLGKFINEDEPVSITWAIFFSLKNC